MTTRAVTLNFPLLERIYCLVPKIEPQETEHGNVSMDMKVTTRERDDIREWMHENARDPFRFERLYPTDGKPQWSGTTALGVDKRPEKLWYGCTLHCSDHDYVLFKIRFGQ